MESSKVATKTEELVTSLQSKNLRFWGLKEYPILRPLPESNLSQGKIPPMEKTTFAIALEAILFPVRGYTVATIDHPAQDL
jgi:hypothetical protein